MEILAVLLFVSIFLLILYGYPVAFTLGGMSAIYAFCFLDAADLLVLPTRLMGIGTNYVLIAVPLFVFMGIMLEKSGLAERLLTTMGTLLGRLPGGLAIAVILVGTLLAASTGIVGATVITMGLISMPTMLKQGYSPALSSGVIAASATLGQIIPPSVVLVLLGSVLNVSVGSLFAAAVKPGFVLVGAYILYVLWTAWRHPEQAPSAELTAAADRVQATAFYWQLFRALIMPLLLIVAVLGAILAGLASPTEAAALGAMGASLLTIMEGKMSMHTLREVMAKTTEITAMVFMILIGATTFAFVFRELEGDSWLIGLVDQLNLSGNGFLLVVLLLVFVAGFFIDFIEIIFIIVPIVSPVFITLGLDLTWVAILLAINLQTSFLTPPFGFSLFYLKGVIPPEVTTAHLYRGVIPFVVLQLVVLLLCFLFPAMVGAR